MLIIIGKKRTKTVHGYVADFCRMCRDVREIVIWRFGEATSLYGMALDEGGLVGFEAACTVCEHRWHTEAREYDQVSPKPFADVDTLEAVTFPDLREARSDRLVLERQIAQGPRRLPADVRWNLLREVLLGADAALHERGKLTSADGPAVLAGLLTVACTAACIAVLAFDPQALLAGLLAVAVGTGGGIYSLHLVNHEPRRWFKRRFRARLARWLRPLEPTERELRDVLHRLREEKRQVAKVADPAQLVELLRDPAQLDLIDPPPPRPEPGEAPDPRKFAREPLPPASPRIEQMQQPFYAQKDPLRERGKGTHLDRRTALTALLTLGGTAALLAAAVPATTQGGKFGAAAAGLVLFLVGIIYTMHRLQTESHRWYRTRLQARVARRLAPLRPTRRELEEVVERLRHDDELIGKLTDVEQLLDLMQNPHEIERLDPLPPGDRDL